MQTSAYVCVYTHTHTHLQGFIVSDIYFLFIFVPKWCREEAAGPLRGRTDLGSGGGDGGGHRAVTAQVPQVAVRHGIPILGRGAEQPLGLCGQVPAQPQLQPQREDAEAGTHLLCHLGSALVRTGALVGPR